MRSVLLDHLATTPLLPEAFEAMRPFFLEAFGNPASFHRHGLRARDAVQRAREQVAGLLHAGSPDEIVFTSGGTEAINLAIKGVAWAQGSRGRHLVVSAIEQPAALKSVAWLETQGFTCTRVPVDGAGRIDPAAVAAALTDQTILVAIHHAHPELGTLQPVRALAALAAERGIDCFVDATTSAGWVPIDVQDLGATLLAAAPHRFHGPKGVGILHRDRRTRLGPLLHGGDQEQQRRAGTENVPAIVGAGVAAAVAARELPERQARAARLQARLWDGLCARVPHVQLNGPQCGPERLATSLNVSVEFVEGEALVLRLDTRGIALATSSACLGRTVGGSPALAALGLDRTLAQSAVLMSLGRDTTEAEIDHVLAVLPEAVARLRELSPRWEEFQRGQLVALTPARARRADGSLPSASAPPDRVPISDP